MTVSVIPASNAAKTTPPSQTIGWRYQRPASVLVSALDPDFTLPTRIDPGRDCARAVLADALAPGRHDAIAAVAYRMGHACEIAAIQPHIVGQVGCADRLVATPVHAVTGHADGF